MTWSAVIRSLPSRSATPENRFTSPLSFPFTSKTFPNPTCLKIFLAITYKKNTIKILKDAGLPAVIGGLVMSLSFIAFVVATTNTTVANVVFIISTQTMFLAIFGYFYLKETVSLIGFISSILSLSNIS